MSESAVDRAAQAILTKAARGRPLTDDDRAILRAALTNLPKDDPNYQAVAYFAQPRNNPVPDVSSGRGVSLPVGAQPHAAPLAGAAVDPTRLAQTLLGMPPTDVAALNRGPLRPLREGIVPEAVRRIDEGTFSPDRDLLPFTEQLVKMLTKAGRS